MIRDKSISVKQKWDEGPEGLGPGTCRLLVVHVTLLAKSAEGIRQT